MILVLIPTLLYGQHQYSAQFETPEAELHFVQGLRRLTKIEVADDSRHLKLTDDSLFDYPFLFAQQVGRWHLSNDETAILREYLLRGGFLVVDDFHGPREWQVFEEAARRVFPHRPIVELKANNDLLNVHFALDQRTQILGARHLRGGRDGSWGGQMRNNPPHWRGIFNDDGQLMIAINCNMNMGVAWEHADDAFYPEPMTALAYRFGINDVIYAMSH